MIASSVTRVACNTSEPVNQEIRRHTEERIAYYALHPEEIDDRLEELDQEWDIERALAAGSSILSLTGAALGLISGRRKWLFLPVVVQAFYLQHTLQGWCPPLPVLRRLGFRTAYEIERERAALRGLRGDFRGVSVAEQTGVLFGQGASPLSP